ncbi:MAG TPA: TadE/TadG family type IV pilus assembly protein [Azospirillum sp.]|nr:TadE/TadG family type IV pilus assembly protein [Azospirillum sp.]
MAIPALARALRDRRGVAALEFAVAAPALLLALFGIIDVASYVATSNRLQRLAAEVANIGSQFDGLRGCMAVSKGNEVGVLFLAAREIAKPLYFPEPADGAISVAGGAAKTVPVTAGGLIVTSVADKGGGPRIAWQAYAGIAPTNSRIGTGTAAVQLPAGFTLRPGDDTLFVEVFLTFQPYLLSGGWTGTGNPTVTAYSSAVFRPRLGALTALDPC